MTNLTDITEEHNLFLDKLEDIGLIKQEPNKDIVEVRIKKVLGEKPIVEIIYEIDWRDYIDKD